MKWLTKEQALERWPMDNSDDRQVFERKIENIPKGMRPGVRQLNSASLVVALSDAVPEKMKWRTREIHTFHVPPDDRRKKLGTLLLNLVCQEADANKITLVLIARAEGYTTFETSELVEWYKKFGFQVLQETPHGIFMARQVHEKPRVWVDERNLVDEHVRQQIRREELH